MTALVFNADRVGDLSSYDDLNTVRGRALFVVLVVDYMRYLKSDPATRPDWSEATEMETATKFLAMINNDQAWPFAQQVIRDFQEPA
ncbi:hypothetical protein G647_10422 [Cladophialophora carrionii CBS 160.54]|uniref:Uncharacterized protein n=1 Tax=Cladophialophora carrionii CBS 160.54 TaxID=1279043 RepID=V9DJW4_9EURO|nr:uncharacterized protein G647_10422 [Cladophialophora carrionii CBS 160.54]ETI26608.1 hypothetical protein G647_10422 [Cladophialophora carrionii CBS 160.54]